MISSSPWWAPHVHVDRRPFLLGRNRLVAALRSWFAERDFVEVSGAILQRSPGNETHLHAFTTMLLASDGEQQPLYLHTSPEFSAKKLIAAGETRIVDFARVFRNRERTATHHPEFTMLEWYRTRESYETLMEDCAALLQLAAETSGKDRFTFRGVSIDPRLSPERVSVSDACRDLAAIDLLATVDASGETDREALADAARRSGVRVVDDDSWSDIFSRILAEKVEPYLGRGRATILDRYPAPEAALARRAADDPRVAERFELFACGLELANAFGELTDPVEQRARFVADMDLKEKLYGERYPIDEDLLAALALMPPTAGIALGLDRLAMLATGAERIEQVIWSPVVGLGSG